MVTSWKGENWNVITGKFERKRSRGRRIEKMLDSLALRHDKTSTSQMIGSTWDKRLDSHENQCLMARTTRRIILPFLLHPSAFPFLLPLPSLEAEAKYKQYKTTLKGVDYTTVKKKEKITNHTPVSDLTASTIRIMYHANWHSGHVSPYISIPGVWNQYFWCYSSKPPS